jgi:5'-nucleotidase
MSFLLVTNDDGVECPSLPPFLRALSKLAPVRAVVPARERSWIAKAITRFEAVATRRETRGGVEVVVADGFPADCTQLGVHSLFGERPEMVISGINVGYNHGRAFLLSSGTVGAAAEGWIAGLPALAFSTGDASRHEAWAKEAWSEVRARCGSASPRCAPTWSGACARPACRRTRTW